MPAFHVRTFVSVQPFSHSAIQRFGVSASLILVSFVFSACSAERGKSSASLEGGSVGISSGADTGARARVDSGASAALAPGGAAAPSATVAASPAPVTAARPGEVAVGNRTVGRIDVDKEFPIVRALYVNRFAAQSSKRMKQLIQIADETEINALVIDMKDEFGLNYVPSNKEFARNGGRAGIIKGLPAMLDTLRAHHILPIARMVVFKDSVTAAVHPEWTIRRQDGTLWRDKKNNAWVNPYHHELWDYNIGVAEELVKLGFGEVQFDYIRFPEPYPSLPTQVFPNSKGEPKPDVPAFFANSGFDGA